MKVERWIGTPDPGEGGAIVCQVMFCIHRANPMFCIAQFSGVKCDQWQRGRENQTELQRSNFSDLSLSVHAALSNVIFHTTN